MMSQWEFAVLDGLGRLHDPLLDQVMVFVTSLADQGTMWVVLGLLFLCFPKTRHMGAALLVSAGLGYVTGNLILKNLFARSRPCWLRREVKLLIPVPRDYSFPSGHTLVSVEGAFAIWRHDWKWGVLAFAAAAMIACSRMYLYVHFPTDILGGVILGLVNGWAGERLVRLAQNPWNQEDGRDVP